MNFFYFFCSLSVIRINFRLWGECETRTEKFKSFSFGLALPHVLPA